MIELPNGKRMPFAVDHVTSYGFKNGMRDCG